MKLHPKQFQFSGSYWEIWGGDGTTFSRDLNYKQTQGLALSGNVLNVRRPSPNAGLGYRNRMFAAGDAFPVSPWVTACVWMYRVLGLIQQNTKHLRHDPEPLEVKGSFHGLQEALDPCWNGGEPSSLLEQMMATPWKPTQLHFLVPAVNLVYKLYSAAIRDCIIHSVAHK